MNLDLLPSLLVEVQRPEISLSFYHCRPVPWSGGGKRTRLQRQTESDWSGHEHNESKKQRPQTRLPLNREVQKHQGPEQGLQDVERPLFIAQYHPGDRGETENVLRRGNRVRYPLEGSTRRTHKPRVQRHAGGLQEKNESHVLDFVAQESLHQM